MKLYELKHTEHSYTKMNSQPQPSNPETTPSFSRRMVLLVVVFAVACCLLVVAVWATFGVGSVPTVLLVSGVCFLAAVLAHLVGEFPRGEIFLTSRVLASAFVRAGIPLVLLLILKITNSHHLENGAVYFVCVLYVVTLVADLMIHVRQFKSLMTPNKHLSSSVGKG